MFIMQIKDKAENASGSADRHGDRDVLPLSVAKELIDEAYKSGFTAAMSFVKRNDPELGCELEKLLRDFSA